MQLHDDFPSCNDAERSRQSIKDYFHFESHFDNISHIFFTFSLVTNNFLSITSLFDSSIYLELIGVNFDSVERSLMFSF